METSPTRSLSEPSGDQLEKAEPATWGVHKDASGVYWHPNEVSGEDEEASETSDVHLTEPTAVKGHSSDEMTPVESKTISSQGDEESRTLEAPQKPRARQSPTARPKLSDEEFEALVESALARIPPELMEAVENCAIIVEAEPPPGQPGLLGLYQGRPLTSRGYYAGAMPDRITIYQGSLQRLYRDPERLEEQVYRTVVHEIGHYFGFEEDELHELGWG